MSFPLKELFDVSSRITRDDREIVEAQMRLYALKDGDDPFGREANRAIDELRVAVRRHNTSVPPSATRPGKWSPPRWRKVPDAKIAVPSSSA